MTRAIGRDKECLLCDVAAKLRKGFGLPPVKPKRPRASHIVSRKSSFWTILDEVDISGLNIFSDAGVLLIKQKLMGDPFLSNEEFIIALCPEHDGLLVNCLKRSAAA